MRIKLPNLLFVSTSFMLLVSFTISYSAGTYSRQLPRDTSFPSFTKAIAHKGRTIISSNELIRFSTGMDNDMYLADTISRHCYLFVQTGVKNLNRESMKRLPLNLSIVIDRSGSMKGEKMDHAIEAAKNIVDKLSETDIVSIIAYGDEVDVVQPAISASRKERIKEKINNITTRGGTNLWGGCETGYYQVLEHYKPGYINHVFLISDGLANVGVVSSKGIKANVQRFNDEEGITLSSFGVGLDFNEVLLSEMAEAGSGNYYFIDKPGKIKGMLEAELNSLLHIVAREAMLTIQLPTGVKAGKLSPFNYTIDGQAINIKFRDMEEGMGKQVLVDLNIADSARSQLSFTSVLSYKDVRTGQKKQLENINNILPQIHGQYLANFNREVIGKVLLLKAVENMEAAITEVDKYNYFAAAKMLEQNRKLLDDHRIYINELNSLQRLDSASIQYSRYLPGMKFITRDSMRLIQKTSRAFLDRIRNGK